MLYTLSRLAIVFLAINGVERFMGVPIGGLRWQQVALAGLIVLVVGAPALMHDKST